MRSKRIGRRGSRAAAGRGGGRGDSQRREFANAPEETTPLNAQPQSVGKASEPRSHTPLSPDRRGCGSLCSGTQVHVIHRGDAWLGTGGVGKHARAPGPSLLPPTLPSAPRDSVRTPRGNQSGSGRTRGRRCRLAPGCQTRGLGMAAALKPEPRGTGDTEQDGEVSERRWVGDVDEAGTGRRLVAGAEGAGPPSRAWGVTCPPRGQVFSVREVAQACASCRTAAGRGSERRTRPEQPPATQVGARVRLKGKPPRSGALGSPRLGAGPCPL